MAKVWSKWTLSPFTGEGVNEYLHAMYKDYNLLIKPVIHPLEKEAKGITELAQVCLGTMPQQGTTFNVENEKQSKFSTTEDWLQKLWYREVKNI